MSVKDQSSLSVGVKRGRQDSIRPGRTQGGRGGGGEDCRNGSRYKEFRLLCSFFKNPSRTPRKRLKHNYMKCINDILKYVNCSYNDNQYMNNLYI